MALFCAFLLVTTLLYVCGEFFQLDMSLFAGASKQQKFFCSTLMILLTISLLPLSLRLFKFERIRADLLSRQAPALLRWGIVRLMLMGLLLTVNTFLYYAFEFESAYGYLAVVVLLCMPFVVPTMSRCQSEVVYQEQPQEQPQPYNETNDEEANSSHSQL